jgi:hypothetical protein
MNIKKEKEWITQGLNACVVLVDNDYRCGYIGVDKSHFLHEIEYKDIDINVHGGLTFSGHRISGGQSLWWLGFDCAHSSDKTKRNQDGTYRDLCYCIRECEVLAAQINAFKNTSFEYYCLSKKRKLQETEHNKMISLAALNEDYYATLYVKSL